MTKTISFDIHAGKDGGVGIYEMVPDQPAELVFGGNLEEATKYLNKRIGEVINGQVKAELPPPKPVYKTVNLTNAGLAKDPE